MKLSKYFNEIKSSKSKFVSIELCTNRNVEMDLLNVIQSPFYSVVWLDNNLNNLQLHPSVLLSKKLIGNGFNVLLHLTGSCLDKKTALELLSLIKEIGVKNIFAIRGGKWLLWYIQHVTTDKKLRSCRFSYTCSFCHTRYFLWFSLYADLKVTWRIFRLHFRDNVGLDDDDFGEITRSVDQYE